jgi:hypothetical protein
MGVMELLSDIGSAFQSLNTPLEEAERIQSLADKAMTPVIYTQFDTAVITPNSSCIIRLVGPDLGHSQYVHSISVWCPQLGVANTVNFEADLFVTSFDYRVYGNGFINQLNGIDWRDRFVGSQFQTKFYRRNQIYLNSGQDLFIWFSVGITPGLQMAAMAIMIDFEDSPGKMIWEL